jgi:hypothetical protein
MRKLVVIGVVLVVLAGAFALVLANLGKLVDRNKDFFLSRAEESLGRQVSVGEVGVKLWGGVGVSLQDFSLADDAAFSAVPFIEAHKLQVNLKLLPLLKKQFEVKRVILREPVIRIIRNEDGVLNTSTFGTADASAGPGSQSDDSDSGASALIVSLVSIDNGVVHYVDRRAGHDIRVTDIDSKVENMEIDTPTSIEIKAALFSEEKNVELSGTVTPTGDDPTPEDIEVDGQLMIEPVELAALTEAFPSIADALPADAEMRGPLTFHSKIAGSPTSLDFMVAVQATQVAFQLPGRFNKPEGTIAEINSRVHVTREKITLSATEVAFHSLEATGQGEVILATGDQPPSVRLKLASEATTFDGWDTIVPALQDFAPAGEVAFEATLTGPISKETKPKFNLVAKIKDGAVTLPDFPKPISDIRSDIFFDLSDADDQSSDVNVLEARNTACRVGDTHVQGEVIVGSLEPLSIDFDARSPSLVLNDVRPSPTEAGKNDVLKDVSANGRITVDGKPTGKGTLSSKAGAVAGYDYNELKGAFTIDGAQTEFHNVEVRTLGGAITGSGAVTSGDSPSFNIQSQSRNLNVAQLIENLPISSKRLLNGNANLDLNVAGSGKDWGNIKTTVTGDGLAEMLDGSILDLNIVDELIREVTAATGLSDIISQRVRAKYPKVFNDKNTDFRDLSSTFVIEDGKLKARNLALEASDYTLRGVGAIDFNRGLELRVTLIATSELTRDLIQDYSGVSYLTNNEGRVEIPFVLTGTLPKARIKPDPDFLNSVIQKALVGEGTELLKKKGIGDGLKGIFDKFGNKNKDKKKDAPADTTKSP